MKKQQEERVVAKADEQKNNKSWNVDDEHIRSTSKYIRHSFRGRVLYRYMMFLMFIESVWWTLMDITRAHRMRIAARITNKR